MTANAPENDYMSDVASQSNRMYRSVSGQSLGELESQQQEQNRQVRKGPSTNYVTHTNLRPFLSYYYALCLTSGAHFDS